MSPSTPFLGLNHALLLGAFLSTPSLFLTGGTRREQRPIRFQLTSLVERFFGENLWLSVVLFIPLSCPVCLYVPPDF